MLVKREKGRRVGVGGKHQKARQSKQYRIWIYLGQTEPPSSVWLLNIFQSLSHFGFYHPFYS